MSDSLRLAIGAALSEMCGHPLGASVDAGDYLGGVPTVQAFANVIAENMAGWTAIRSTSAMEKLDEIAARYERTCAESNARIKALSEQLAKIQGIGPAILDGNLPEGQHR